MTSVLISWTIIFASSLIFGYGAVRFLYRNNRETLWKLDVYLIFGLMLINIYAEMFSLFYKVGILACFVLAVFGVCMLIGIKMSGGGYKLSVNSSWLEAVKGKEWRIVFIVFGIGATLFWTVGYPRHYDTSLYHFQAIKWVEEYGVVPGLGNLHHRFAYNSAFMPLQALFSLEWLFKQSLHSVNGYICAFAIVYAVATNNLLSGKKIRLSDLLKIVMLFYIYENRELISSPCTDILAMLLVLYISIKWSEFAERDIKDAMPYAFLCLLAVWSVTVKMSSAVCVMLALYPAIAFIKGRHWKKIAGHIWGGFMVLLPWLIRNVIISGYLLYPYPQIDLFNVDWKMPASVCIYDAREIIVWGREIKKVALYDLPVWKWFPVWFEGKPKVITVLGLLAGLVIICYLCYHLIRKKKLDARYSLLLACSAFSLAAWFFSAPLLRYGMVYLLIPIGEVIWIVLAREKSKLVNQRSVRIAGICLYVAMYSIYISNWDGIKEYPIFMQENYEWKLTDSIEIADGVRIWYPVESDQGSYDVFPCAPHIEMIKKIEPRGKSLADGFRIKQEYKALHLNEYGYEW